MNTHPDALQRELVHRLTGLREWIREYSASRHVQDRVLYYIHTWIVAEREKLRQEVGRGK